MQGNRKVVILFVWGAVLRSISTLAEEVFITRSCLGSGIEFLHLCPCSLASLHDTLYHLTFTSLTLSTCDLPPVFLSSTFSPSSQVNISFFETVPVNLLLCPHHLLHHHHLPLLLNVISTIFLLSKSSVHNVIVPDNLCTRNWIFFLLLFGSFFLSL